MHFHLSIEGAGRLRGLAGLALAGALACGGGGKSSTDGESESGGTAGEAIAIDEFFVAAEQAFCGWAAGCGAFADAEACAAVHFFDAIYPRSLLASAQLQPGDDGVAVAYLLASHEAGRIEFDAEAAQTCLAYVETRGCFEPHTYAPSEEEVAGRAACGSIFRGTMVLNGPCLLSMECATPDDADVVCGFDPACGGNLCCLGGCRKLGTVPIGTPCTNQTPCEAGSFCARDPNSGLFTTCTAQRPVGAACQSLNECDDAGYCDLNSGVCRALAGKDQACQDFGDGGCQAGLFCADPGFDGNPTCYGYAALGESCPGEWYADGCKEIGVACDRDTNSCAGLPTAGQPCAPTNQGDGCAPSASCNWQTDTCVARAGEGEPCGDYIRCAGSLYCDGWDPVEARCRAPEVSSVCPVPAADALPEGT